jgi:hypothetical protein
MRATILSGLALLLAIAALRLRLPERGAVRRGTPWASLFLGFAALALTLSEALQAPYFRWNDPRLAPTAAIFAGYPLYAGRDHGVLIGHIYGPVSPVIFAPALLLPTPGLAIAFGVVWAFAIVALPVAALLVLESARHRLLAWLAFLAFWVYVLTSQILSRTAFIIHADAPAMGLAALACVFVYSPKHRTKLWALGLSALAADLAVGSKQVMIPLLLILPLWVGLVDGWRALRRYVAVAIPVGLAALLVVASLVDFKAMIFNALTVPGEHPLKSESALALVTRAMRDLTPRMVLFALIVAAAVATARDRSDLWRRPRAWMKEHPWSLLALLSLSCIPTAVLGRSVIGGSLNALAYPLYFAEAAALLALVDVARRPDPVLGTPAMPAVAFVLLLLSGTLAVSHVRTIVNLPATARAFATNPEDLGLAFARAHPGEVYLPFKPLVTLMAEHTAYHFSYGIYDRFLAGMPVSADQFRAYVPPRMRYVAAQELEVGNYYCIWVTGFTRRMKVDGLPGWTVLTREDRETPQ